MRPALRSLARRLSGLRAECGRLARQEQGASLIESATSISLLMMLLMAVVAGTLIVFSDIFVGTAAHLATRYAMVRGSSFAPTPCTSTTTTNCAATNANVLSYVQSVAPAGISTGASSLSAVTTWPGTSVTGSAACATTGGSANSPGCLVTVQVTYSFNYSLPFISGSALNLVSTSSVTIVQ